MPISGKTVKRAGSRQAEVKLSRCVSRIDVTNKDDRYQLVSASLWNVFPHIHVWETGFINYTDEGHLNGFATCYTDSQSENKITGSLYTFENYVSSPKQDDTITTCLIVGMKNLSDENRIEYFRINLNPASESQLLKRNHLYQITIKNVVKAGKGKEKDAYEDKEIRLSGTITSWEEDDFSNIQFDGDNVLALSFSKVNFSPAAGEKTVEIFTRGTGEVILSQKELPAGITADLNAAKDKLLITAGSTQDDREGLVEVQFGSLRATLQISQQGKNSEWIKISPTTLPVFPFKKPENTLAHEIQVTASGAWGVRLYNGDAEKPNEVDETIKPFSLDSENLVTEITNAEVDGNTFYIYLHQDNKFFFPRYGFITVYLRDNPAINRMILLTQDEKRI